MDTDLDVPERSAVIELGHGGGDAVEPDRIGAASLDVRDSKAGPEVW
jgi:hypothetical protein